MMRPKRNILVVDEFQFFRDFAALTLARLGCVLTSGSSMEALELARRERPDLIIVDLHMPDLDGEGFCKVMRQDSTLAKIPVVVMSASDLPSDRARALRAGANDLLSKLLNRAEFLNEVERYLRDGGPGRLPRIKLETPVRIRCEREEHPGTLRNLSRAGLFVETRFTPLPGSEVYVEMELPELPRVIQVSARVIWRKTPQDNQTGGMGLHFLEMDGDSARALETYVNQRIVTGSDEVTARQ